MSHVTLCPKCSRAYMASSEEDANDPDRQCYECWDAARERAQHDALELDRRIEADEAASLHQHGAPDEREEV